MKVHRCPKCALKGRNHGFQLTVSALMTCNFIQVFHKNGYKSDKTFPPLINRGDEPLWSGESTMSCLDCGHVDRAIEFVSEYFPNTEPLVTEHTYSNMN